MRHIMLDLETLGTKPGCVVLSFGAVAFDPYRGTLGETFYRKIDLETELGAGRKVSAATLKWWLDQSEAARKEAFSGTYPAFIVAAEFSDFWKSQEAEFIWANDPTFDCDVWEAAAGWVPWNFRAPRSCRTIFDLAGIWPDRSVGVAHNALDDAKNQAVAVMKCYAKLGVMHGPEEFAR